MALSDIVRLAKLRGDDKLKAAALAPIEDPNFRRQLSFTPCLEAGRRPALDEASQEKSQWIGLPHGNLTGSGPPIGWVGIGAAKPT